MYAPSLFPSRERSSSLTGNTPYKGGSAGSPYLGTAGATPGMATNESTGLRNRRNSISNGSSTTRRGAGRRVEWESELRTPRTVYSEQRSAPPTASLWDELQSPNTNFQSPYSTHQESPGQKWGTPANETNYHNQHFSRVGDPGSLLNRHQSTPLSSNFDLNANSTNRIHSATSHNYTSQSTHTRYERWVLVFGFSSKDRPHYYNIGNDLEPPIRVLDEFRSFGDVIDHDTGNYSDGNWCFLRYASTWQADKAVQHGAVLVDGCGIVGALRVTSDIAHRFGLNVDDLGNSLKSGSGFSLHSSSMQNNGLFTADNWSFAAFFGGRPQQPRPPSTNNNNNNNDHQQQDHRRFTNHDFQQSDTLPPRATNWCARLVQYLFATDLSQPR